MQPSLRVANIFVCALNDEYSSFIKKSESESILNNRSKPDYKAYGVSGNSFPHFLISSFTLCGADVIGNQQCRTRKGGWAIAPSPILNTTITPATKRL